jgi:hypothetical protein
MRLLREPYGQVEAWIHRLRRAAAGAEPPAA